MNLIDTCRHTQARHPGRRIARRLLLLPGAGTAYLVDSLGLHREAAPGGMDQWHETTSLRRMIRAAAAGADVLYRVGTLHGRRRIFLRSPQKEA